MIYYTMDYITKEFDYLENDSYLFKEELLQECWKFGMNKALIVATCLYDENIKFRRIINQLEDENIQYVVKDCMEDIIQKII